MGRAYYTSERTLRQGGGAGLSHTVGESPHWRSPTGKNRGQVHLDAGAVGFRADVKRVRHPGEPLVNWYHLLAIVSVGSYNMLAYI